MQHIMARAGEGGGDQLLALNCAHAWAHLYGTKVELEYHWVSKEDFKYVASDPEFMSERVDLMHSKLLRPELVHVEHVWGSDVFEYHNAHDDLELRRTMVIKKWFIPKTSDDLHPYGRPFSALDGQAEWGFAEIPTKQKKIVMWDYAENRESPKEFKIHRLWDTDMFETLTNTFPEYDIVRLTYRDSFARAYEEIRDCEFCFGYDGMWHIVARNFGKLFVNLTNDILHTHRMTNPRCAAFDDEKVYEYLSKLKDKEFLASEQKRTEDYHTMRMNQYEDFKR